MSDALLSGKAIIVTGGAAGIGAATCLKLSDAGAAVAVADVDVPGAEGVAEKINAAGGRAFAMEVDVRDPDANEAVVAETRSRFGAVDGAFLNAGIVVLSSLAEGNLETWKNVLDVNLTGPFLGMRALIPHLQPGAAIVITSSVAGLRGTLYMPSYIVAKHGLLGLTKAAAAELAPRSIRVNAVCPGAIHTTAAQGMTPEMARLVGNAHPLRRAGEAEEVADLVAFLLSDQSAFITGQAIAIDGGCSNILAEGEAFPGESQSVMKRAAAEFGEE